MKLVCFDIDGTMLWTDGAGRRAIHRALVEELGTAGPIDGFRFDGRTDGEIILRLAEAAGVGTENGAVERVIARYVANLGAELLRPGHVTKIYPGVVALLDALGRRSDCMLGLVTGNVVDGARLKLGSAGIAFDQFAVGGFGSDSHVRAELPGIAQVRAKALGADVAGRDVVIIGDTPDDVACGRGIGARAVGVGTAAYTAQQLLDCGAAAAFDDLSDTETVVEVLLA